MPQFDIFSFPFQTFYFILTCFLIYCVIKYYYLKPIAETLKMRKKLLLNSSTSQSTFFFLDNTLKAVI